MSEKIQLSRTITPQKKQIDQYTDIIELRPARAKPRYLSSDGAAPAEILGFLCDREKLMDD